MIVSIDKAEYTGNFTINFLFSDGVHQSINFYPFLKDAKNPMTRKYLDENLFRNYSIEYGDIVWNNYELCFPVWDIYKGKI